MTFYSRSKDEDLGKRNKRIRLSKIKLDEKTKKVITFLVVAVTIILIGAQTLYLLIQLDRPTRSYGYFANIARQSGIVSKKNYIDPEDRPYVVVKYAAGIVLTITSASGVLIITYKVL